RPADLGASSRQVSIFLPHPAQERSVHPKKIRTFALAVVIGMLLPIALYAISELNFKPGFNLYSVQQDVTAGRQSAAQVEKQMPMLHDAAVSQYVNQLGRKLASFAPNNQPVYVWDFFVVNTNDINAFALPGGYIFVNRGTIQAAQNEAQLAGVMAHEIGHVVMRHGTHQASEKALVRTPLSILGSILGASGSTAAGLAQAGLGFGVNSIFLHNSRGMESQADEVGTYILYHAGYDPHAMAQFFEIIQKRYPQQTIQFFSDHPDPGNRIRAVDQEIPLLGPAKHWITNTPQFEAIKSRVKSLPQPPPPPRPRQ
ncbi:MAG: M48 family metallopeptidase, partial [Terriglobia bacterium]